MKYEYEYENMKGLWSSPAPKVHQVWHWRSQHWNAGNTSTSLSGLPGEKVYSEWIYSLLLKESVEPEVKSSGLFRSHKSLPHPLCLLGNISAYKVLTPSGRRRDTGKRAHVLVLTHTPCNCWKQNYFFISYLLLSILMPQ